MCFKIGYFAKVSLITNQISVSGKEMWSASKLAGWGKARVLVFEMSDVMAEKSMDIFLQYFEKPENRNCLFRGQEGRFRVAYGSPIQSCANVFFPLPSVFWMNGGMGEGGLEESWLGLNRTSDLKYNLCIYHMGNRGLKKLGEPFTSPK